MIGTFAYAEKIGQPDHIPLIQALERCSAVYRNLCITQRCGEHPNPLWVKLYLASERLKHAVRQHEAAQGILEIGSHLMGCNDMAIMELQEASGLSLLACTGMTAVQQKGLAENSVLLVSAIGEEKISIVNTDTPYEQLWSELGTTAFVPLWYDRKPKGALLFYRFLPQQKDLDQADRELLRLLSIFAGPALFTA